MFNWGPAAGLITGMFLLWNGQGAAQAAVPANSPDGPIDFTRRIRPILSENCFACHGPDEKKRKAGLRLDLKAEVFKKLKSGEFALVPGDPEHSELIRRITTADEDDRMPPLKSGKHLVPEQVELLRRWVAQGATYKDHWAYTKPERPALPEVRLKNWPRNAIDYFILSRLENEGLKPSAEAPRETLIRRASLDLIGLPPSVRDVDEFVRDNRPDAYECLVDRLLSSPQYGERWARPWLDQARYADSNGYEADFLRSIWPYRDWVISAFNRDLPFDQFTIEQLAGDLLPNCTIEQRVATGFHRNTMVNTEGGTDDEEFRVAAVVDRVNTTFAVWMGTTIGCAQCHNHKYDPFTQREYYQLFAFFNQTKDKGRSNESELELPTPEQKAKREEIRARIEPLERVLNTQTLDLDQAQALWQQDLEAYAQNVESSWVRLDPEQLEATGGVTLSKLDDQSVRSGGALPETSTYEITAHTSLQGVTAIRLETLADEQLPHRSSGRSEEGDFVLTELTVQAWPAGQANPQPPERPALGDWQMLGPFHAATVRESYSREFITESQSKVDLAQSFEDGKLRWTERTDFQDGVVQPLAGEIAATYLFRTITAAQAMPMMIGLGSEGGIQVWLNGKKVLSREVERAVAPNQDFLELQLAKGENQLLMKINSGGGSSAFYFSVSDDPSEVNRVGFETAYADFSMENYDVKDAIDGKPMTGWSIAAFEPTNRVDHQAVFITREPVGFPDQTRLVIRLKQESNRRQHLLGRFRLSLSTAPAEALRRWLLRYCRTPEVRERGPKYTDSRTPMRTSWKRQKNSLNELWRQAKYSLTSS